MPLKEQQRIALRRAADQYYSSRNIYSSSEDYHYLHLLLLKNRAYMLVKNHFKEDE